MSLTTRFISIAVIAIVTATSLFAAGSPQPLSSKKWETAEKNYITALKTGNDGVKISVAGFLAHYRLKGGIPALTELLNTDKSENVRISAALALIMLDETEGRTAVEQSSLYDGSDRVARFCEALLKAHSDKGPALAAE